MIFSYRTKMHGKIYYLHSKLITLKNGKPQRIYYFAQNVTDGLAVDNLPEGYEVHEGPRGLPLLRKKKM
jgi:hypothetical protein